MSMFKFGYGMCWIRIDFGYASTLDVFGFGWICLDTNHDMCLYFHCVGYVCWIRLDMQRFWIRLDTLGYAYVWI